MSTTKPASSAPQVAKATRRAMGGASAQKKVGPKKDDALSWKIEKCTLVYYTKLQADQDTCAICKSSLTDPCNQCQTNGVIDNCPIIQGECGHFFHGHCISQWIRRAPTCPICSQRWEPASS